MGVSDSEKQIILVELYLQFSLDLTEIFSMGVLNLEKNELTICEVYCVMEKIKIELEHRINVICFLIVRCNSC